MNNKISIPEPCHENWDAMLPEAQGKHCLSCCKTVIDFSSWDNERILSYLKQRNTERVCGRFKTEQLEERPAPQLEIVQQVLQSGMPLLRKIAAIIVLCFGLTGINDAQAQKRMGKVALPKQSVEKYHTKGEIAVQPADTVKPAPQLDTVKPAPVIMGIIAPYKSPEVKKIKPTRVTRQTKAVRVAPTIKTNPEKR